MNSPGRVAAIVLAAGSSSRMGALKPGLRIGGASLVELASNCFLQADLQDVTVVVGRGAGKIVRILHDFPVKWVLNTEYESGMLSSVLTGIRSLDSRTEAFFLLPCDIPLVRPETIRTMFAAYCVRPSPVIYPVFHGRRGHPPLIALSSVRDLTADCAGGLRSYLRGFADRSLEVETTDRGILLDCDTPEDYRELRAYAISEGISNGKNRGLIFHECEGEYDFTR